MSERSLSGSRQSWRTPVAPRTLGRTFAVQASHESEAFFQHACAAGRRQDEWRGAGQRHRGAKGRRRGYVRYPMRADWLGAGNDIAAVNRDLQIGPEAAA